jgi:5-methylcytosine-specific restriction protein A
MATRAPHLCNAPNCPNTTSFRYCVDHEHRAISETALFEKNRKQSQYRGYGSAWKRYRSWFLKNNPLCVDPGRRHEGRVVAATQVDHIIPHKMDMILFWSTDNHQALCASCGGFKSATEEGGRAHSGRRDLAPISGHVGFEWTNEDL